MPNTTKTALPFTLVALAALAAMFSHAGFSQETSDTVLPRLSTADAEWLGERIFANECAAQRACLTSWNEGEDFPSLGIGHFIWFQRNQDEIFAETFPDLLTYLDETGITLPKWLQPNNLINNNDRPDGDIRAGDFSRDISGETPSEGKDSPWESRADFYQDIDSPRMEELRTLLDSTRREQAQFIIARLENSIGDIVAQAPSTEREHLQRRVERLSTCHSPAGLYALIDYVHFKGTGLAEGERYAGQGWGLQQVLSAMSDDLPALDSFASAAKTTLERRVANAPTERREQRWLKGWHNRIDTYLAAATLPTARGECK
jgi:hypothetical protein